MGMEVLSHATAWAAQSRPTLGDRVVVVREGKDKGREGEIIIDMKAKLPNDPRPYKVSRLQVQ
jgi:hypothetical protein